jgi:hypothetical protein
MKSAILNIAGIIRLNESHLIAATWFLLSLLLFDHNLNAQTCCSGGVPLANNIGGLAQAEKGTFQLAFNFDGNYLRTLKDGRETLDDKTRQRTTYSFLLKTNYTLSDRFSIETLFTVVQQRRFIQQNEFTDFTKSTGLGDAAVLVHYKYYNKNDYLFSFGAGPKIPVGPSDLKDENGITLNADLQPGSGAWDALLHHSISKKLNFRPSLLVTNLITYRITGENPDYLGSQVYEFGDEFQAVISLSEQNTLGKSLVGYGLLVRYRYAQQDRNNGEWLPNTGGQWVFLAPALSWYIQPDLIFTVNGELPVFSQVTGTQLTPTFRINAGILISLKKNKGLMDIR